MAEPTSREPAQASNTPTRAGQSRFGLLATAALLCTLVIAAVVVIVVVGIGSSTPSNGDSCDNASAAEISAWVQDNARKIPSQTPVPYAQAGAQFVCDEASVDGSTMRFGDDLLADTVADLMPYAPDNCDAEAPTVSACLVGVKAPGTSSLRSATAKSLVAAVQTLNSAVTESGTSGNPVSDTCQLYPGDGTYQVVLAVQGPDSPGICSAVGDQSFAGVLWSKSGDYFGHGASPGKAGISCSVGSNVGADAIVVQYAHAGNGNVNAKLVCKALENSGAWSSS